MLQLSGHGGADPRVVTFTVNIRKFVVRANRLSELVELGTLTRQAAAFLDACVVARLNIVVAGGTQAGREQVRKGACKPRHAVAAEYAWNREPARQRDRRRRALGVPADPGLLRGVRASLVARGGTFPAHRTSGRHHNVTRPGRRPSMRGGVDE